MQHLTMETLARLADEEADGAEAAHLAACGECRAEVEAMREQAELLGGLPLRPAPRGGWTALERGLRAEGLLVGAPRGRGGVLLRIAASLALFAAGGALGARLASGGAASAELAVAPPAARTAAEADLAVRRTEAAYLDALTRYAELSGGAESAVDPVNRLAALEGIVLTTRAALEEAPADPVINGYHLTALSQREAILRQIDAGRRDGAEWF